MDVSKEGVLIKVFMIGYNFMICFLNVFNLVVVVVLGLVMMEIVELVSKV